MSAHVATLDEWKRPPLTRLSLGSVNIEPVVRRSQPMYAYHDAPISPALPLRDQFWSPSSGSDHGAYAQFEAHEKGQAKAERHPFARQALQRAAVQGAPEALLQPAAEASEVAPNGDHGQSPSCGWEWPVVPTTEGGETLDPDAPDHQRFAASAARLHRGDRSHPAQVLRLPDRHEAEAQLGKVVQHVRDRRTHWSKLEAALARVRSESAKRDALSSPTCTTHAVEVCTPEEDSVSASASWWHHGRQSGSNDSRDDDVDGESSSSLDWGVDCEDAAVVMAHGATIITGTDTDATPPSGCEHQDGPRIRAKALVGAYSVDKRAKRVFWNNRVVPGCSVASFMALGGPFARDSSDVWWEGIRLPRVDAASFQRLPLDDATSLEARAPWAPRSPWSRDACRVYWGPKLVAGANAPSFRVLTPLWAVDATRVWYAGRVVDGSTGFGPTFRLQGRWWGYARGDPDRAFVCGRAVQGYVVVDNVEWLGGGGYMRQRNPYLTWQRPSLLLQRSESRRALRRRRRRRRRQQQQQQQQQQPVSEECGPSDRGAEATSRRASMPGSPLSGSGFVWWKGTRLEEADVSTFALCPCVRADALSASQRHHDAACAVAQENKDSLSSWAYDGCGHVWYKGRMVAEAQGQACACDRCTHIGEAPPDGGSPDDDDTGAADEQHCTPRPFARPRPIAGTHWALVGRRVFWRSKWVQRASAVCFHVYATAPDYASDSMYAYWRGRFIPGAYGPTFEPQGNSPASAWAKDSVGAWYGCQRVVADGPAFAAASPWYAKDCVDVYTVGPQRLTPLPATTDDDEGLQRDGNAGKGVHTKDTPRHRLPAHFVDLGQGSGLAQANHLLYDRGSAFPTVATSTRM